MADETIRFDVAMRRQPDERVTCTGMPQDKGLRHLQEKSGVVLADANAMWAFVLFDEGYRVYMEHSCLTLEQANDERRSDND